MKPINTKPDLLAEDALERFRDIVLGWPLLCRTGFVRFIREHQTQKAQHDALALRRDDWFLFPEIHAQLATQTLNGKLFGGMREFSAALNNTATPSLTTTLCQRLQEPDGLSFGVRSLAALMTQSYRRSSHAHHHDHDPTSTPSSKGPMDGHDLPDAYRIMLIDQLSQQLADHPAVRPHLDAPNQAVTDFMHRPDIQHHLNHFARPVRKGLQKALPVLIAGLTAEGQELRQHLPTLPMLAWHEARQASIIRDALIQNQEDRTTHHQRPLIAAWHWIAGGIITGAAMLHLSGGLNMFPSVSAPHDPQTRAEQIERAGLWGGTVPLSAFYATSQQWDDLPRILRKLEIPGGLLMGHLTTEMALAIGNVSAATQQGFQEHNPVKISGAIANAYSDFALDVLSDIYLTAQMTNLGMKTARLLRKRKNGLPDNIQKGLDRADYTGIGIGVAFAFGGLAAVDGVMLETVDKAVPWLLPGVVATIYGGASADLLLQKARQTQPNKIADFCTRNIQKYGLAVSTWALAACASLGGVLGFAAPAGVPISPNIPATQPPTTITIKPSAPKAQAPSVHNIRVKPGNAMWTLLEDHLPKVQKTAVTQRQIGNIVQQMQQKSNVDLIYPNENLRLEATDTGINITFRRQIFKVDQNGKAVLQRAPNPIAPQNNASASFTPQMALAR